MASNTYKQKIMDYVRPELFDVFMKIYGADFYSKREFLTYKERFALFDFFGESSEEYKKDFIKYFNKEEKRIKIEDVVSYEDSVLEYEQFYSTFNIDIKKGKIFKNTNSFNLFYLIYKSGKSLNKYGLKKYLFKEYIESDILTKEKINILIKVAEDFYKEFDINKYVLGNINFIYSDYNEKELDVLFDMGLFIKEDNAENKIFKVDSKITILDFLVLDSDIGEKIKKGKIFSNDTIYECFLYFYNNVDSFRKYGTRRNLIKDFLEKKYIGLESSIKYIGILIEYIKSLDEIFSTPFYKIIDDLFKFNLELKKGLIKNHNDDGLEKYGIFDYDGAGIDGTLDSIYSDIELKFLSIFYNTDKIKGYKYYEGEYFIDSSYIKENKNHKSGDLGLNHLDYNNLFNNIKNNE